MSFRVSIPCTRAQGERIGAGDDPFADRDDPAAIERLHMGAGQGEVHAVDLDAGRELRLVERTLDGLGR